MRALKFRVWDGERMHNVSGQGLHLVFWNDPTRIAWGLYNASEAKVADSQYGIAKLIEWTGLKDRNGRDIYEGDLVNHEDAVDPCCVNFYNGMFIAQAFDGLGYDISAPCGIIGNIYEHPELIPA